MSYVPTPRPPAPKGVATPAMDAPRFAPALTELADRRHAESVADWSRGIAVELGLDHAHADRVALAGCLHDIGKLCVPRSILDKPGPLSPVEWAQVRLHPEHGARLLADSAFDDVRPWVLLHHERPDGAGYPFALGAAHIPLEAAIIATADGWSAMTSDRPYQSAMPDRDAMAELEAGAGTQWVEDVVWAMLRLVNGHAGAQPPARATARARPVS